MGRPKIKKGDEETIPTAVQDVKDWSAITEETATAILSNVNPYMASDDYEKTIEEPPAAQQEEEAPIPVSLPPREVLVAEVKPEDVKVVEDNPYSRNRNQQRIKVTNPGKNRPIVSPTRGNDTNPSKVNRHIVKARPDR